MAIIRMPPTWCLNFETFNIIRKLFFYFLCYWIGSNKSPEFKFRLKYFYIFSIELKMSKLDNLFNCQMWQKKHSLPKPIFFYNITNFFHNISITKMTKITFLSKLDQCWIKYIWRRTLRRRVEMYNHWILLIFGIFLFSFFIKHHSFELKNSFKSYD